MVSFDLYQKMRKRNQHDPRQDDKKKNPLPTIRAAGNIILFVIFLGVLAHISIVQSERFLDGSASRFPIYLSFGVVGTALSAVSGEDKYKILVFALFGQNETGEIPLWLCLVDSQFQEIFYLALFFLILLNVSCVMPK